MLEPCHDDAGGLPSPRLLLQQEYLPAGVVSQARVVNDADYAGASQLTNADSLAPCLQAGPALNKHHSSVEYIESKDNSSALRLAMC